MCPASHRVRRRKQILRLGWLVVWILMLGCAAGAAAQPLDEAGRSVEANERQADEQPSLFRVNDATTVRDIRFRFSGTRTFEEDRLKEEMATAEPGFLDAVKRVLPFLHPNTYPFQPLRLQKDVVRLREFYNRRGFIDADIQYFDSRFDTTRNRITVILTIEEGPPLILDTLHFVDSTGTPADSLFEDALFDDRVARRWQRFLQRRSLRTGRRYSETQKLRLQDEVLTWLKEHGYPFAQVGVRTEVDTSSYTVDLTYRIRPGVKGYFSEIEVDGNESVSESIILRELPFKPGDLYSSRALARGQQELFGLELFRVALADLPLQPQDSTIQVRFRVREGNLRYVSAEAGYGTETGITLEGGWAHRNFLGGARHLSLNGLVETGIGTTTRNQPYPPRAVRVSMSLRQPYLGTTALSGFLSPFAQAEYDPRLLSSDAFARLNRLEFGITPTLIYDFGTYQLISLQYNFSRASQQARRVTGIDSLDTDGELQDAFNKSILTLKGTLGQVDNFLNPRRGFFIRPTVEVAGRVFESGVNYYKVGAEFIGYLPLLPRVHLIGRVMGGRLWPTSASRRALSGDAGPVLNARYEDRFDPIMYYAGGASDVRGWSLEQLGPKLARAEYVRGPEGELQLDDQGRPLLRNVQYEPAGGRAKVAANLEVQLPFPGLGNNWRTAVFLDMGQVSGEVVREGGVFFRDTGRLRLADLRYGTGAGVRLETPVGFLRLDLAYKLNPSDRDLQDPREVLWYVNGYQDQPPDRKLLRRFSLHFSLGRSF